MTETAAKDDAPAQGSVWRHWRTGTEYRVLGMVYIEAGAVLSVAYRRNDNQLAPIWVRPLSEWNEVVSPETRRFDLVKERDESDAR